MTTCRWRPWSSPRSRRLPESGLIAPGALGAAAVQLPAHSAAVDFISDLHLHPSQPNTLAAFEALLAHTRCDALFILGDLFEVWIGDDALTQDFEARCAAALTALAQRIPVYALHGNRDFLLGEHFFAATGVTPIADPCLLTRGQEHLLLSHGDALCLADAAYQQFRAQVRQPAWQQAFLARPWAERAAIARQMRDASKEHQREPGGYADADTALTEQWLAAAEASTLVHGHTHHPAVHALPSGGERWVLSDWDLDGQHGETPRAEVLRWTPNGLVRLTPAQACV